MPLQRRSLLAGSLMTLLYPAAALAGQSLRVAAIDWAMLETSVALGVMPMAATELIQFRKSAVEPALPNEVVDLGLRGSVNFELLHLLKPELILISPFYQQQTAALSTIAPVVSLPFYVPGEPPLEKALNAVLKLAERLGRQQQAKAVLARHDDDMNARRQALASQAERPIYLINLGDARHFRAFGNDSMFGDVLQRLGLRNAWQDTSRFTFNAPVPLERLAAEPDARIVIVSEVPVEARSDLAGSMIWRSLEPVRQKRLSFLGNVNPYGGIIAADRFSRLLTKALLRDGDRS